MQTWANKLNFSNLGTSNHFGQCETEECNLGCLLEVLSHSGLSRESLFTGTNTVIIEIILCVTVGTINYSGELLCRQWDNNEVDFRGVLGACEWFTHHLTCMGTQNNNSNDGGKSRIFPYMCVNGRRLPGSGRGDWDYQGWGWNMGIYKCVSCAQKTFNGFLRLC